MTEALIAVGFILAVVVGIYVFEQLPSKGVDTNWKPEDGGRPWEDSRY